MSLEDDGELTDIWLVAQALRNILFLAVTIDY